MRPGTPETERLRRPRFQDIAREAGVGTATVERVLNGRANVLPKTAQRVIIAARKLGYDRTLPSVHHACVRIEVVLVRPDTEFFSRLNRQFQRIGASLDKSLVIQRNLLPEDTLEAIARRIEAAAQKRTGLITVVQDSPAIISALKAADANNVPIVLLVSDVRYGGRAVYVGIDNESAGRTAGFFMRHLLSGRRGQIVALCHSGDYLAHRQRVISLSQCFCDPDDDLIFTTCLLARDSDEMSYALLRKTLRHDDDVVGVYNAGGGNGGVDRALRECRRPDDVAYIGYEMLPSTRRSLEDGVMVLTIDQAPELQVRRAVEVMETMIGLRDEPPNGSPIPFRIITQENLDG
ncbi:MAG: LacI family DNA-binding transcriptional regulator [Acetobacteraceae bacterium]|nr:LacI family DNA-binding transcriptional regulator [Acetobacteraceae bacterium]